MAEASSCSSCALPRPLPLHASQDAHTAQRIGRPIPQLADVYIYGDDGRPYRGSLNMDISKGGEPRAARSAIAVEAKRHAASRGRVGLVTPTTAPKEGHSMRLANQSLIEAAGLQPSHPTVLGAGPAINPLGRRVINPITPYELWGLKNPGMNRRRASAALPSLPGDGGAQRPNTVAASQSWQAGNTPPPPAQLAGPSAVQHQRSAG